ncbi:efflux transporter outer membrane subunit [Bartonella sp. LJL80]
MQKWCSKNAGKLPKRVSALAGLLLLSGCLVGPDYQKPSFLLASHWSSDSRETPSQPAQIAGWWRRLNDPLLEKLVADAIAGNNDVATAKAKLREARASLWQTTGTLYPSLDGSASGSRSKSAGGPEGSQYRGGFDSSWEIDLFGANRRAVEAAKYGLDGAKEDMRATMVTLIGDVATNYAEARGLQQKIALAQRTAASQKRTAQLTRDKFAAGAVSQLDVSNAEGQAASTEAGIPQMEANLATTIHRLSVLTGQSPTALNDTMKKTGRVPQPKWPIPAGVPADILLTRPDVRLAERQYAQSTARIGQAEAARYPSVTLTGNISTAATQPGQLGKDSSISWSFGPGVSVPIFNGGQREAAVEIARAQRDQSFIAYRSSVLTALEDVENALVSMRKERQRSGKLAQASTAYSKALELSRSLYESGNTSFLELLNAERSHYSSEQSLIESRVAITTDYIALMKALGGGWDGTVETSRPEIVDGYTGPHIKTAQAGSETR